MDSVAAADARVREMQGELDANAAVFELRERLIRGSKTNPCPCGFWLVQTQEGVGFGLRRKCRHHMIQRTTPHHITSHTVKT